LRNEKKQSAFGAVARKSHDIKNTEGKARGAMEGKKEA
jgi:hypothetical protein